jgi:ABC-type multidrug transport system fused ATPase/permease subunit
MAIARALVREAPVLLLDEATANIDVETEADLVRELFASQHGRTVVFVTHRVATAVHADRICVMEGGRMVGLGSHAELLAGCPTYQRLWQAAAPGPPSEHAPVRPLAIYDGAAPAGGEAAAGVVRAP